MLDTHFNPQTMVGRYITLKLATSKKFHLRTDHYASPTSPALLLWEKARSSTTIELVHLGQAIGNVTQVGQVALLLCLPSDKVHHESHRYISSKRCHREQNRATENLQKGESLQNYAPSPPPCSTYFRLQTDLNHSAATFSPPLHFVTRMLTYRRHHRLPPSWISVSGFN